MVHWSKKPSAERPAWYCLVSWGFGSPLQLFSTFWLRTGSLACFFGFWMRKFCVALWTDCIPETGSVSGLLGRPISHSCDNHLGFGVEWWLGTMVMNACLLPKSCAGKYLHRRKKDTFIWNSNIYFKFCEYIISKHYPPTEQLPSILLVLLSWLFPLTAWDNSTSSLLIAVSIPFPI